MSTSHPRALYASFFVLSILGGCGSAPAAPGDAGVGSVVRLDAASANDAVVEPDASGTIEDAYVRFTDAVVDALCAAEYACTGPVRSVPLSAYCLGRAHELTWEDPRGSAVRFDPSRAEACIAAIEAEPCAALEVWARGCAGAVSGTLATGAECTHDMECAGGATCAAESGDCPRCTPRARDGEACDVARCAEGLACRVSSSGSVCTTIGAVGDSCEHPCGRGLFCDTSTFRCAAVVEARVGETCGAAVGRRCERGLACGFDGVSLRCMAPITIGAPCRVGSDDPCHDGTVCSEIGGEPGVCLELPRFLEPCAPGSLACGAGLTCRDGTCAAIAPLGLYCDADADCLSDACDAGRCVRRTCE